MFISPSVMARYNYPYYTLRNPCQGLFRTLTGLTTLLIMLTLTSCRDEPFEIPDPPSFDWKASIYQNPIPIVEVNEPECDIMPPLDGADPPFNGYYYYHTSPDPIIWKIRLNKSRRDLIAYISYVPDLEAPKQEQAGHFTISIKDLISGEVTLVDEMWQGYHLGFDFAGDYLIYERNFEGYLYNWKTQEKNKLGIHVDDPSLSPDAKLISYEDLNFENKGNQVIIEIANSDTLFSINNRIVRGNLIWLTNDEVFFADKDYQLFKLKVGQSDPFSEYLNPISGGGLGFLVGLSVDQSFLYGNSFSIIDLKSQTSLRFKDLIIPNDCGNRDVTNFFILPDNTFMMRKTYYISDHEKRTVYPEYHWHLFDADGSNERRVDLQL